VNLELVGTRTMSQELLGFGRASRRIDTIFFFCRMLSAYYTPTSRLIGQADYLAEHTQAYALISRIYVVPYFLALSTPIGCLPSA
jgi:hypothetical protein